MYRVHSLLTGRQKEPWAGLSNKRQILGEAFTGRKAVAAIERASSYSSSSEVLGAERSLLCRGKVVLAGAEPLHIADMGTASVHLRHPHLDSAANKPQKWSLLPLCPVHRLQDACE